MSPGFWIITVGDYAFGFNKRLSRKELLDFLSKDPDLESVYNELKTGATMRYSKPVRYAEEIPRY